MDRGRAPNGIGHLMILYFIIEVVVTDRFHCTNRPLLNNNNIVDIEVTKVQTITGRGKQQNNKGWRMLKTDDIPLSHFTALDVSKS